MNQDKTIDLPLYFLYEDKNGWRKTNATLTKEILDHIRYGKPFDCAGRSFFPQYEKPKWLSETKVAWKVNADGVEVARWFWKVRHHEKKHGTRCRMVDGKRCGVKVLHRLRWDDKKKIWVLVEVADQATPDEERILDQKDRT